MFFRALSEKADKAVIATKVWTLSIFPDHQGPVANNCVQTMVRHLATFRAFPADLGQLIQCINIAGWEQFIRNGVVSCQFMLCMFRQPWMSLLNILLYHWIQISTHINTLFYIYINIHDMHNNTIEFVIFSARRKGGEVLIVVLIAFLETQLH